MEIKLPSACVTISVSFVVNSLCGKVLYSYTATESVATRSSWLIVI